MGIKAERRQRVMTLLGVEDAFEALDGSLAAAARYDRRVRLGAFSAEQALERLDRGLDAAHVPVDISLAAELLEISEATTRDWVNRGILEVVPHHRPTAVSFESLRWARRLLRELRAANPRRQCGRELGAALLKDRPAITQPGPQGFVLRQS